MKLEKKNGRKENPPLMIAMSFALLIGAGSILLMLPVSSASGECTSLLDAFFTAVSAVCVTGLVVHNTAEYWSIFGQVILLLLIQIGGLGFMTMTTLIFASVGKKMSFHDFRLVKEQLNQENYFEIIPFVQHVLRLTVGAELIGAILLATRFIPYYGWSYGLWASAFHAVSAFCNAGFDVTGTSMMQWEDPVVILTIAALIILGGLGFSVISDLKRGWKLKHFSLHTKMVLSITMSLLVFGTIVFFVAEYSNPATIGEKGILLKLLHSFFQSVTARTAGFNSIDIGSMRSVSAFMMIMLMFIGASPGSTGGGIKTTTAGVLALSTISEIQGNKDIVAFRNRISERLVRKSLALVVMALSWVLLTTLVLSITEKADFLDLLFEATSAFGTVGVSRNLTPELSGVAKVLLAMSMFGGRVGLMTIGLALSGRKGKENFIRYAEGVLPIG